MESHIEICNKRMRDILSQPPKHRHKLARLEEDAKQAESKLRPTDLMPALVNIFPSNPNIRQRYYQVASDLPNAQAVCPAFEADLDEAIDAVTRKWCAIYELRLRMDYEREHKNGMPTIDLSNDREDLRLQSQIAEVRKELEDDLKEKSIYDDSELSDSEPSSPSYSPSEAEDDGEAEWVYIPPTKTRKDAEKLSKRPTLMRRAKSG